MPNQNLLDTSDWEDSSNIAEIIRETRTEVARQVLMDDNWSTNLQTFDYPEFLDSIGSKIECLQSLE